MESLGRGKLFFAKFLSVLLIFFYCLAILNFSTYAANQDLSVFLSSDLTAVNKDDIITITAALTNYNTSIIPELAGLQLNIPINSEYFEFVQNSTALYITKEEGDLDRISYNDSTREIVYIYAYFNSARIPLHRTNTNIFSFKLKVLKDIPENSEINCTVVAGDTASPTNRVSYTVAPVVLTKKLANNNTVELTTTTAVATTQEITQATEITTVLQQTTFNLNTVETQITNKGTIIRSDNLNEIIKELQESNQIEITPEILEQLENTNEILVTEQNGEILIYTDPDQNGTFNNLVTTVSSEKIASLNSPTNPMSTTTSPLTYSSPATSSSSTDSGFILTVLFTIVLFVIVAVIIGVIIIRSKKFSKNT